LGRRTRRRRKRREPGRGRYEKDRPAIVAWGSRQGPRVGQAVRACTVATGQQAAGLAGPAGRRLYTASASRYRALQGYRQAVIEHTQKDYARGEVHAHRTACLFSLLKPYRRVVRGLSQGNLPGDLGFCQFLRNARHQHAFDPAELILPAALDPALASKARKGEFVTWFDHVNLRHTAIN
jgi:hypothetical protein